MRNVRPFVVVITLLTLSAGRTLRAQQTAPAPQAVPQSAHAPDSGRIVFEHQLGGDSVQAAALDLRRGAIYRVEVRNERADVQIRRRVRDGSSAPLLDTVPLPRTDSLLHWRVFGVVAREGGTHVAELANPGVGAALVRVSLVRRASDDTLPSTARRTLVFSDHVSGGPSYVTLDSGMVYRIVAIDADISLAPRASYRAPVRIAPLVRGSGSGVPFIPEFSGEYRIDAIDAPTSVWIYLEQADAHEIACIRDPSSPGCHGNSSTMTWRAALALGLFLPVVMLLGTIFK